MNLRPYQHEILNETRQAYRDGFNAPCIVAPCGAGKSVIAAEMARGATRKNNRVLFLVHRKELREQIENTFRNHGVDMSLCCVGMVQTVVRRLDRMPPPDLIITDENHHSPAAGYRKIYDYFPQAKRVGVTATPTRLNGGGLGDVNDKLVVGVSTRWLIDNQHLAPFTYYAPPVADLSGLHTRRGEFIAAEIEERLNKRAIYGDVIAYYQRYSAGKQAICYCASIRHSQRMADAFTAAGIHALHFDGDTAKDRRDAAVNAFRRGDIDILCNVDLISEGFDVPDCHTSILLRPTQSLTLYIQQSMRCMRYKPGKQAVILDHVGNYARFGLPDADREWTLETEPVREAQNPAETVRQCPACYYVHNLSPVCPACGFVYPVKSRKVSENKHAVLTVIEGFKLNNGRKPDNGFKLDYTNPEDCRSMRELYAYAAEKGFKPGWAYYRGKAMGFI